MNCMAYPVGVQSLSSGKKTYGAALSRVAIILLSAMLVPVPTLNQNALKAQSRDSELKNYSQKFALSQQAEEEYKKGKHYYEDDSYELARNHMVTALRLDHEHLGARYYLGLVESSCRHHSLAIEHFLAVYKKEPHYQELSLELAASHLELGRCTEARTWLDRHLKTKPESKKTRELDKKIKDCKKRQEKSGG